MTDVQAFVRSYFEAIGAEALPMPTGALAVRWPPTHVAKFGPTTTLAFDPAVAEVAKAELCVPGSAILDRILEDASGRGFHCIARVSVEGEPPAQEVLAANLKFRNAKPELLSAERGVVPYILFNFRVTLVTDEKVEFVRSVLLNAETMREHAAAETFLQESLSIPEDPVVTGGDLAEAYKAACLLLERSIQPDVEAVRKKAEGLLRDELERLGSFYENSISELYEGRTQAPLEAEQVFRAERDRRVEEVKRKYALTADARLVNARTILIPTTTMLVRVSNAHAVRELGFEFDAVNLETNRLVCDACGASTDTVFLCSRRHIACDACDRACALCDYVACATCAPGLFVTCTTCVKSVCPDHAFLDEIGGKAYCGDHIHACAICGRMVGPAYVKSCGLCAQAYCAMCVDTTERCTTCRTLASIPMTHEDVLWVTTPGGRASGVSRWLRGQNGKYTVLVGKGAVYQQLYVINKDRIVVHRRKGTGLLVA